MADWDERPVALALKTEIQTIMDALNKHHRNVISRVTGSSVAIATGIPAAACAIAAPFTLGVTLIPAIVLGIIAAVGGGVSVGASVTEIFIKKHNVKGVQAKWASFREKYCQKYGDNSKGVNIGNLNARTSGTSTTAGAENIKTILQGIAGLFQSTSGIASAASRGAFRSVSAGIRVASPFLSVASCVALPLDIVDLVTASLRLHRGAKSSATDSLMEIIDFLDKVVNRDNCKNINIKTIIVMALAIAVTLTVMATMPVYWSLTVILLVCFCFILAMTTGWRNHNP